MSTGTITQPQLAERILDSFPSGTYLHGHAAASDRRGRD